MTLYSNGNETGVVVDCGEGSSFCIPIYNNYLLNDKVKKLSVGGKHITNHLALLLQFKGLFLHSIVDYEYIKDIKEKYCFVSCDIESDRKLNNESTYYNTIHKLPDGKKILVSGEKFEAPEILFQPNLIHQDNYGIHELLFEAIKVRKYYYNKNLLILEL